MYTFSQKFYIKKFEKIMSKSEAVRMDEKEVLKFGEEALKTWAKSRGWIAYCLKVKAPSGNLESISMAVIAKNMQDLIAIINNAVSELSNAKMQNLGMDKIRIDILSQYKQRLTELLNEYISMHTEAEQTSLATV